MCNIIIVFSCFKGSVYCLFTVITHILCIYLGYILYFSSFIVLLCYSNSSRNGKVAVFDQFLLRKTKNGGNPHSTDEIWYTDSMKTTNETDLTETIKMIKTNYTYILRCVDGSLYTGWTNDLEKRLKAHNAGTASKYTRSRRPVALVWHTTSATKEQAMSLEARIKRLSRADKLKLISGEAALESLLSPPTDLLTE